MITARLAAYRSWGLLGLEPWNVQWVGDIAAFCFATATGMG